MAKDKETDLKEVAFEWDHEESVELGDENYEKKGVHTDGGVGLLDTSRDQTVIVVGFG